MTLHETVHVDQCRMTASAAACQCRLAASYDNAVPDYANNICPRRVMKAAPGSPVELERQALVRLPAPLAGLVHQRQVAYCPRVRLLLLGSRLRPAGAPPSFLMITAYVVTRVGPARTRTPSAWLCAVCSMSTLKPGKGIADGYKKVESVCRSCYIQRTSLFGLVSAVS
jgi:hypothetical protein